MKCAYSWAQVITCVDDLRGCGNRENVCTHESLKITLVSEGAEWSYQSRWHCCLSMPPLSLGRVHALVATGAYHNVLLSAKNGKLTHQRLDRGLQTDSAVQGTPAWCERFVLLQSSVSAYLSRGLGAWVMGYTFEDV